MGDNHPKRVLSPHDIAKICQVNCDTVETWIREGRLETFEIPGGHKRVRRDHLEEFVKLGHVQKAPLWESLSSKYRVLIVEDDNDLLEIIGEIVSDEQNLEIRMEQNGFNAGLQIASWHPDLVLLDFLMPGVNGFDICQRVRESPDIKDIPVLAITGLTTEQSRQAVMQCGISDFLGKPFRGEDLLTKVRILLGICEKSPNSNAA